MARVVWSNLVRGLGIIALSIMILALVVVGFSKARKKCRGVYKRILCGVDQEHHVLEKDS